MKTLYFIYFIAIFIIISCNEKDKEENEYINEQTKVINIPENMDQTSHSDSIFSSVTFLPLETKPECTISFIMNLKIVDSLIYINDGLKRLLVFDSNGRFKYQIGSKGNGPGEYLEMRDYIVHKDHIEILDFKKILTYSLSGKYLETKHFEFLDKNQYCNADFFTPSPLDGYYFWAGTSGIKDFETKNKRYLMYHVNDDMKIQKGELPVTHGSGSSFYRYSNYDDMIIIDPSYADYNIYQINKKGEVSSRYYLNFGDKAYTKKIPIPDRNSIPQIKEELRNYVVETRNFSETKNWLHIDFVYKEVIHSVLYSKKRDKVYLLSPASETLASNEFRFWGALFAYEETLVMPIEASWMQIELERMSLENIKKLNLEQYKDKNEFDNPFLVYYKLQ